MNLHPEITLNRNLEIDQTPNENDNKHQINKYEVQKSWRKQATELEKGYELEDCKHDNRSLFRAIEREETKWRISIVYVFGA